MQQLMNAFHVYIIACQCYLWSVLYITWNNVNTNNYENFVMHSLKQVYFHVICVDLYGVNQFHNICVELDFRKP